MNDELTLHQKQAVEALEKLDEICKNNGITFFLLAGTTLGAVRHKGMIPWDDDIDIGLKYNDWHKLRTILKTQEILPYSYVDESVKTGYPRLFGKILYNDEGCIDLFLISKWPLSSIKEKFFWQIRKFSVEFYKYAIGYRHVTKPNTPFGKRVKFFIANLVRRTIYIFVSLFFKKDDYIKLARWNEKKLDSYDSGCYINLYSIYSMKKEMIKKEWIDNPSTVLFENREYLTVGDTHAYLTHLYGDYMTPPKEKHRVATHVENF